MNTNFKYLYEFNSVKSSLILKVAQPLKDNFGIDFLSYRRFYKNGDLVYLLNNQDWMNFSFEKEWIHSEGLHKRLPILYSKGCFNYIWPRTPPENDPVYGALHFLNIRNGIALYKGYDDCVEVFVFSGTNASEVTDDLYLNNISILDRFILYFREKLSLLTENINKKCILKHNIFDQSIDSKDEFSKYYEQTTYKKFYLRIAGKQINLSRKETECLNLLSQGKSIKEIGDILCISSRTVETHINNTKIKTDIFSKTKLIDVFSKERKKYQV